jgi:hypothetical protein
MARSAWRLSLLAGITGLAVVAFPLGGASGRPHARSQRPAVGDTCLIGTWHADREVSQTNYNGTMVTMRSRGGDVDHIGKSGIDRDNWKHSTPAVGRLQHHRLTERIRGVNRSRLRVARHQGKRILTITELGWSKGSSNRFVYRGKHSRGYLSQNGSTRVRYRCTATRLTVLRHGKVVVIETRLSRKP